MECIHLTFFIESVHEIAEYSKKEKTNKVLVDIRNVEGNPSIFERYLIGLEISKVWSKNIQAATVAKQEVSNAMAENVAVNRGANFRAFTNIELAFEWLNITDKE